MPKARCYMTDPSGNTVLFAEIDLETKKKIKYVSDEQIAEWRKKISEKVGRVASELVMNNPNSGLLTL